MTVVAEVLVQKVVAEVQNTGRIITALQPVVIAVSEAGYSRSFLLGGM